jgi:hypothetical protein
MFVDDVKEVLARHTSKFVAHGIIKRFCTVEGLAFNELKTSHVPKLLEKVRSSLILFGCEDRGDIIEREIKTLK